MRHSGRQVQQLRKVTLEPGISRYAEGSCLISFGHTKVLCTATVENSVPPFLRNTGKGWVTAEYGMLPRSTHTRMQRDGRRGQVSGRTQEIQRLIGRSLRAVTDLNALGERQILVDCDVIEADGGTRTASITGAYVALALACKGLVSAKSVAKQPMREPVAAISCGIYKGTPILDLEYEEDSAAEVDANFVMTASGKLIEVQATGEENAFSEEQLHAMMGLAKKGIAELVAMQKKY